MRAAILFAALTGASASMAQAGLRMPPLHVLDAYNVVWTSPSRDASGSMPIGNGEVGLNLWVEDGGDLLFYISRTDAWSEACRLLKLCRVRIRLDPNPFVKGKKFRQELILRAGRIHIDAGDASLDVIVDSDSPVIWVTGTSKAGKMVRASLETWRTDGKKELKGQELDSSWTMRASPNPVFESGDHYSGTPNKVELYHRNEWSIVPLTLEHQGLLEKSNGSDPSDLSNLPFKFKDPLNHRTFGAHLAGLDFMKGGKNAIYSDWPVKSFAIQIVAESRQTRSAEEWSANVQKIGRENANPNVARKRTEAWWNAFWQRSWVFVDGDSVESSDPKSKTQNPKSLVTRSYLLQRYVTACGGRGNYPIKFNGSIFTVEPTAMGIKQDPDWRRWGDCYWWQNTRFPYHAMLAAGDFEMMEPLFRMYEDALPLCEARAKLYHGVEGAYFPETMTIFGTYANGDYGWDRTGYKPNEVLCPWWQYAWNQGPELLGLMLDRYEYTEDRNWYVKRANPMVRSVLVYFLTRFRSGPGNALKLEPTQAVETYWHGVVNDTPSIAGLREVLDRRNQAEVALAKSRNGAFTLYNLQFLPHVPIKDGKIQPAESFDPKRSNVENPELYAIWPFRLYGIGRGRSDPGPRQGFGAPREGVRQPAEGVWQPAKGVWQPAKDVWQPAKDVWQPAEGSWQLAEGVWQAAERVWQPAKILAQLAELHSPQSKIQNLSRAKPRDPKSKTERPSTFDLLPSNLEIAQKTFRERFEKSNLGWQYDGQVAALCGLTEDAKASLLAKAANSNPAYRWPATWGPNYDWLPDQCHGSNLMITLQTMLLQPVGDKLYLFPAWPKEWNVRFKLHAPKRTTVEGEYRSGVLSDLKVTPKSRAKDVVLPSWVKSGTDVRG